MQNILLWKFCGNLIPIYHFIFLPCLYSWCIHWKQEHLFYFGALSGLLSILTESKVINNVVTSSASLFFYISTHEIFGLTSQLGKTAKNFEMFYFTTVLSDSVGFIQWVCSSTLPGMILPSQYSTLGDCFHNTVLHTAMPEFLPVGSRHNHSATFDVKYSVWWCLQNWQIFGDFNFCVSKAVSKSPFAWENPTANVLVLPSCSSNCFKIHIQTDVILKTENQETEGMENMYN